MRFSDLPLDLLSYILDQLSEREYKSLVRVCKSLHKEATPYLYRDISLTASNPRRCTRKLAFLLRTFLERSQLAAHVRSFRLLGNHYYWGRENAPQKEGGLGTTQFWVLQDVKILSKAQMVLASNQFYPLVDEEMHKPLAQFQGRNKDALAILVLARLSQLQTLEVGDGFLTYSLYLPQILKRANDLFPRLSHITFGDKNREPGAEDAIAYVDLDLIRPVFYHPAVKTFECVMPQPWRFEWKKEAPRSESLTKIHLFRTDINRETLGRLLAGTVNLKSFHYEQELPLNATVFWPSPWRIAQSLNINGLNAALSYVGNTLEECRLSLEPAPDSLSPEQLATAGWWFPPIDGTLTVLNNMKRLSKVEVPLIYILGWFPDTAVRLERALPSNITNLSLRDDIVGYCPWVEGFSCNKKIGHISEYVEARSVHAPQLETLNVRLVGGKSYWLDHAVKALGSSISGPGVSQTSSTEGRTETHSWALKEQSW